MAWGCFSSLPCPYRKWDEEARDYMLAGLSLIGLFHGLIWWGLCLLLVKWLIVPRIIVAVILGLTLPALSGFIHVDGYMDCCDAIFSRRDLAERQRILKDSSVGAFAVIGLVLIFLLQCAAMYEAAYRMELIPLFVVIPVISRMMSSEAVWSYRSLSTSQYHKSLSSEQLKNRKKAEAFMSISTLLVIIGFFLIFDREELFKLVTAFDLVLVIELAAHFISCRAARKNLGGMSGDISGFAITISEAAAMVAMAVI